MVYEWLRTHELPHFSSSLCSSDQPLGYQTLIVTLSAPGFENSLSQVLSLANQASWFLVREGFKQVLCRNLVYPWCILGAREVKNCMTDIWLDKEGSGRVLVK